MTISFEQRKAQIKTVEDIDDQIRKAKKYASTLRAKAKAAKTLAEKLELNEQHKLAEKTLRQLRISSFDIKDEINAKQGVFA